MGLGAVALIALVASVPAPAGRAGDSGASSAERKFVGMLNAERQDEGLAALQISPALTAIADDYASDNRRIGNIDHDRDAPYTRRANRAGCDGWLGPVMAKGIGAPSAALEAWLDSPPHRKVLLDPATTHVGPGFDGPYSLAYGLYCDATRPNSGGDYGDPQAIGRRRSLTVGDVRVSGLSLTVSARAKTGSTSGRLVAKGSGRTVLGDVARISGSAAELTAELPEAGDWTVEVKAGGRRYALGIVAAKAATP